MKKVVDKSWSRLFRKVRGWDIGLFLGAGLSVGNRLPSWSELTRALCGHEAYPNIPLPAQIGMARETFRRRHGDDWRSAWIERVRECLYAEYLPQLAAHGLGVEDLRRRESAGAVTEFFDATNPALAEVVRLCGVREDGIRRVVAVATTNLDALLQTCDRAINGKRRRLRTIERATKASDVWKTSVYHLHGYLRPEPGTPPRKEAADRLVLTELDYTRRNDDPSHWAATTLHLALREFPVVFLGCSLDDELVRRALYRTRRHRIADARSEGSKKRLRRHSKPKHFAVCRWRSGDEAANLALAESHRLMDVHTLWVKDYGELAGRLRELRGALGG